GNVCTGENVGCCFGACTKLDSGRNCGGCDVVCEGKQLCCTEGTSAACADLRSDPMHCGDCITHCKPNEACCGGDCRDVLSDPNNCGRCGFVCSAGGASNDASPVAGGVGDICCNGVCRDSQNDHDNCGACGNKCKPTEVCIEGKCVEEHGSAGPAK